MLSQLRNEPKVVGAKQTRRAILDGRATTVFLVQKADPALVEPLEELCKTHNISVVWVPDMPTLGAACGIAVGAAVAALLA